MTTYRSTKDIAATVRENLKRELPEWKFSVTVQSYAGGSSITLALMEGPEQVAVAEHEYLGGGQGANYRPFNSSHPFPGYAQLNHYQLLADQDRERERHLTNGLYLSDKGWQVMKRATKILFAEHWDKSEPATDYFCCNFYAHVQIGRWNREYQVKGGK